MSNNTNSHNLSTFGWNFSFIGDISLSTDSDGNVYIFNLGLESIFSQQSSSQELDSSTYSLSLQQLLQSYSSDQRIFKPQADGSYEGSGTLTWNVDHYELEANGNKIVFRADGQLNYVEYGNGYRLSAGYNNDLLTELSDSNQNSFALNYNSDGRIETITDAEGQVNTYSYDTTGQYLLSVEDANGTTSFSYDNPFDPTVVSSVTYGNGSKVSYDYDHVGRLQQVIYGEGRDAISYIFNESGQIASVTDANREQVLYEYDDNGRLISQQIAGSDRVLSYSYGSAGADFSRHLLK
ncbi:RHS repeat domain-containing protein [Pleurocapsa sp. PCC 7319]|uniref:RHS repeat domain-containing protein n=1 Tax=Pleurocapsa sp. PCC 7319 TaxID=118161 RepID=UPI00034D913F|nr:RHS repeat domain-containing protein [Pleurocapsa sp. PCC 7319]